MKILFIVNEVFLSENLGVMTLSAICKKAGHQTKLVVLSRHNVLKALKSFSPDIVGYSVMTPDMNNILKADEIVKAWIAKQEKSVLRVMGGAHPSVFPEVCNEMALDGVVVGEGDNAILRIIESHEEGRDLSGIPNTIPRGGHLKDMETELIQDLDEIPFLDRDIFYDAAPDLKHFQLRSVKIGRGCPYRCTYCHNHVFNNLFKGCGKIIRRRSVDNVIDELKYVVENYGPVGQIRFGDDTFIYKVDDWVRLFLKRYKEEIGIPFYCLIRSNVITDEMAALLADAGCCSTSLSIESGSDEVRNTILKRGISDEMARESFRLLRKHGIKTQTNSILALPGGTIEDDIQSFLFEHSLKPNVGQFSIWTPFPRTDLTDYAIEIEELPANYEFDNFLWSESPLASYSDEEKKMQINIMHLGPIFCNLPPLFLPYFTKLIRMKPNPVFKLLGSTYALFKYFTSIFYNSVPKNPITMAKLLFLSLKFLSKSKEDNA